MAMASWGTLPSENVSTTFMPSGVSSLMARLMPWGMPPAIWRAAYEGRFLVPEGVILRCAEQVAVIGNGCHTVLFYHPAPRIQNIAPELVNHHSLTKGRRGRVCLVTAPGFFPRFILFLEILVNQLQNIRIVDVIILRYLNQVR